MFYLPLFQTHVTILLSGLMVIIIRHFLVDSENVNDNWLMLFDIGRWGRRNRSVLHKKITSHVIHVSHQAYGKQTVLMYDLRNAMRERMPSIFSWYPIWVIWLDTMIPSVKAHVNMHQATLKYKITQKPYNDNSSATHIVANTADVSAASCADEYIIMSNDTGYDPAVRFWKDKGFAVRRFNVNFCKQAVQRRKKHQVSGSSRYSIQGRYRQ